MPPHALEKVKVQRNESCFGGKKSLKFLKICILLQKVALRDRFFLINALIESVQHKNRID